MSLLEAQKLNHQGTPVVVRPCLFLEIKAHKDGHLMVCESAYGVAGKLVRGSELEILLPAHLYKTSNITAVMKRIR